MAPGHWASFLYNRAFIEFSARGWTHGRPCRVDLSLMIRAKMSVLALTLMAGTLTLTWGNALAVLETRSTYIVTYADGTNARAEASSLRAQDYTVRYVYENLFPGVAVELPASAAQALARNPRVALVEPDGVVTVAESQSPVTWGLDRVDQRQRPLNSIYDYPPSPGAGVEIHIIDTGVLSSHTDLSGRVRRGFDAFNGNSEDCNGHGTHVAGTTAGTTYGLAKQATVVAVRVLDCGGGGTTSGVIAGMDWVAANAVKPAVANMSLGGGGSTSMDQAVDRLVAAGVTVVVAAGNSKADACSSSPARAASAITVGATTNTDARSSFSNYGTCLDIFAPGSSITSAWYTSTTATNTISGTSMASPHVAGAAAVLLGQKRSATPAQVTADIIGAATTGVVTSAGTGSPNRLLYASPDPLTPQALAITTTSLPAGRVGVSYSQALQASGGTAPYSWTVTGLDTANSGLSASTSGVISGTPRVATTYILNVSVTDSATPPVTVSTSLTLTVQPPSVVPGAFNKVSPANGATAVSRTSVSLSWQASSGAVSYQVCLNTTTFCMTWSNVGSSTTAIASSLRSRTIYYWQVRAVNADGTTVANSGTWWRFTTR